MQSDNHFLIAWDDIDEYVKFLCCDNGQTLIDGYLKGLKSNY